MRIFSSASSKPCRERNCSTHGRPSFSNTSGEFAVMTKSSAYRTTLTFNRPSGHIPFGQCLSAALAPQNKRRLSTVHLRYPCQPAKRLTPIQLRGSPPLPHSRDGHLVVGYIPEELQTNPLPEMPVFLGYCWSYSRSSSTRENGLRVFDDEGQSF